MSNTVEKSAVDEMIRKTGREPAPDHDAWVREQIKKRLAKKQAGTAIYHDLDDVAAEFGFDAR